MNESANDHLKRIKMRLMKIRLKILIWATTAATLAVFQMSYLFGQDTGRSTGQERGNYILPATESFHTKAVPLESDTPLHHQGFGAADKAAERVGQMYSFVLQGTARPGVVAIEVLDSNGQVVERTTGKLTGKVGEGRPKQGTSQRQWKPTNFKILGFTDNSNVLTKKLVEGTKVTITGEKGWSVAAIIVSPGKGQGKAKSAGTQITKPKAAAVQNDAQDTEPEVQRLSPQNLPQDPLRIAINNAKQKGIQEAIQEGKLNPAAMQAMQNATGNAPQTAMQNAVPNAPSNTVPPMGRDLRPNAKANPSPQTTGAVAVPPELQAGITAIQSAMSSLLSAGQKWGGHKMKVADFINQALAACGQPKIALREVDVVSADQSAAMQTALTQLTNAKNLFANSTNAWDGRRDQAIALLNQALSEIQAAINFAKDHKTY